MDLEQKYFLSLRNNIKNETSMDNKKKEMRPVSVFQKILEDKRIIRECIQKGGDIKEIARQRGIKFATPL